MDWFLWSAKPNWKPKVLWKSTPHLFDKEFLNEVLVKSFRTRTPTPTRAQHNTTQHVWKYEHIFILYSKCMLKSKVSAVSMLDKKSYHVWSKKILPISLLIFAQICSRVWWHSIPQRNRILWFKKEPFFFNSYRMLLIM